LVNSRVVMAMTERNAVDTRRRGILQGIVPTRKRPRQMLSSLEYL